MSGGRRRRRAKQARRDMRRAKARDQKNRGDTLIADTIRGALAGKHPLGLLGLVSTIIHITDADPIARLGFRHRDPICVDTLIASLSREKHRETTALLAVLAELLLDAADRRDRCLREVAARTTRCLNGFRTYRGSGFTEQCGWRMCLVMTMNC